MMPYHRRGMGLRPVHRIKHVVDNNFALTGATQINQEIIRSVDAPVLSASTHVETGSKVNAIYLKVEVASNETDAGAIPQCYLIVFKNQGTNLTVPAANAVGVDDNKRFVIHQEMVMLNNLAGGNPRTLFNGVISLPRGYRRFGPDDRLQLGFLSPAVNMVVCFQVHYKEFR